MFQIKDYEEKGMPEILKRSLKQWNDLQPLQLFKTTWSVFHFTLGIRKARTSFSDQMNYLILPEFPT